MAAEAGAPVGVVVGTRDPDTDLADWRPPAAGTPATSLAVLSERYGAERSMGDTLAAIREAAADLAANLV